jgi:hypothetical protein
MLECVIHLLLPIQPTGQSLDKPLSIQVAKFDYDPGLHEGDEVSIAELKWGYGESHSFSFNAMVTARRKQIRPGEPDVLRLNIQLEMADKEQIPQMVEVLKTMNQGKLENYPLMEED